MTQEYSTAVRASAQKRRRKNRKDGKSSANRTGALGERGQQGLWAAHLWVCATTEPHNCLLTGSASLHGSTITLRLKPGTVSCLGLSLAPTSAVPASPEWLLI